MQCFVFFMNKYFAFFLFLLFTIGLRAQTVCNAELIRKINEANHSEILNVLLLAKSSQELNFDSDVFIKYKVGNIYSINASIAAIKRIAEQKSCIRIEYTQQHLKPMDDTALVRNRVINVQNGTIPLPQSYDGTGVLIGLIDTGIDFTHPDLKNVDGSSRVKYLWDMKKPLAVNTPTPFGYGQEWNNSQIDLGEANTHSDAAHYGHGTASAGIAAGNGFAINKHKGIAPKSDIMMVALNFNSPGFVIADAVKYLVNKAQQLNKPLVINASVGDYYGSHDGTDLETQLINSLVGNVSGRSLIASAGNAGNIKFHVGYNTSALDTNFTWIKSSSNFFYTSEFSDTSKIKEVNYSVGVNNLGYHDLGSIGFKPYNYALNNIKKDTIFHNAHRIGIVESVASINSFGVYELSLRIIADSANYLWRLEHTGNGRIDAWDFNFVTNNLPSQNQFPFIKKYIKADTLQTMCTGFQCSPHVITVGNYVNLKQYKDVNNVTRFTTELPGQIAQNSSVGPTRQNAIKPDITASGNSIFAASDAATLASFTTLFPNTVLQGGYHKQSGGTSASAPVVAGIAALYFQKNPTANSSELLQAITNCAYNDNYTTLALPNYRWGYGKIDAFQTLLCGTNAVGIESNKINAVFSIYPNPFKNQSTLNFLTDTEKKITLYNTSGQLVFVDYTNDKEYQLSPQNLAAGLYLLRCENEGIMQTVKIAIESH